MTEHKYTDEEVIKALDFCLKELCHCAKCPRFEIGVENCHVMLYNDTIDLINRQKAEISFWMDAAANAKKEAVKEFAERLKKELTTGAAVMRISTLDIINGLVKEFTEEKT